MHVSASAVLVVSRLYRSTEVSIKKSGRIIKDEHGEVACIHLAVAGIAQSSKIRASDTCG